MSWSVLGKGVGVFQGDCLVGMKDLPDNSIDSIVTDPPYGLNFMGKDWDKGVPGQHFWEEMLRVLKPGGYLLAFAGTRTQHRMATNIEDAGFEIRDMLAWVYGSGFPKSKNLGDGWGSCLKPALEPVTMARKSFKGTLENNWVVNGTGGINIDGCRVPLGSDKPYSYPNGRGGKGCFGLDSLSTNLDTPLSGDADGRFPANFIHDGSDEVIAIFPNSNGSGGSTPNVKITGYGNGAVGSGKSDYLGGERTKVNSGSGSAARFFYQAKATKKDRGEGNTHATVKPTDLMAYLCRLVTQPNGVVLDPFAGSGSTGKAAVREGFKFFGMEQSPEYHNIAVERIKHEMEKMK